MKKLLIALIFFFSTAHAISIDEVQVHLVAPNAPILDEGELLGRLMGRHAYIANNLTEFRTDYVRRHEFGHYVGNEYLTLDEQDEYCDLFGRYHVSPTMYGRTSCGENFAEMFVFVVYGIGATLDTAGILESEQALFFDKYLLK